MSRQVIIVLEVSDSVTNEQVHEDLCTTLHEGATLLEYLEDIQVIGSIDKTGDN
jgi:hypothetical protein